MGNRLSKIYTRTGDDGSTGLGDGSRVSKDSARVTAYGTVDEANSAIGIVLGLGLGTAVEAVVPGAGALGRGLFALLLGYLGATVTLAKRDELEDKVERAYHAYWGSLFKAGPEVSSLGDQIEQYACLYTDRVSNLVHYPPGHYFRGPRDRMPHEL